MMDTLLFRIPATTANLGPGFDVFGLALNLYNYFYVSFLPDAKFEIKNTEMEVYPFSELSKNLVYQSYRNVLTKKGFSVEEFPAWEVRLLTEVAIGKGFGSSATAIVAGVQIAKKVLETKKIFLHLKEEIQFFLDLESHPDNVVPARIGGWVFCYNPDYVIKKELPSSLGLCALIPDFVIFTEDSRKQLKHHYKREEVLSNIKGCLLWMEYLHSHNPEYLKLALQSDRMHEPYRYPSIPYIEKIQEFVSDTGCYGMSLSGSGPSLMIYYDRNRESYFQKQLNLLIEELNKNNDVYYQLIFCSPDHEGLVIYQEENPETHKYFSFPFEKTPLNKK